MDTLLIGTTNARKLEHYQKYLEGVTIKLVTLRELSIPEPEETGITLEENARLKADYYFEKSGLPTLADDGGFEILALNNFPGVKSRRFGGSDMSDEDIITGVIERMKGLVGEERKARFRTVLALRLSPNELHITSFQIDGHVPEVPYEKRMAHFPYRSLLFVDSLNKWFYDITPEEDEQIGYRKAGVERIKKYMV